MKCDLCKKDYKELKQCNLCGKEVCDNETCSESFDETDDTLCLECISKLQKCECNKCRNQATDDCPMEGYLYVYECPEYDESKVLGYIKDVSGFHELDWDEQDCAWPGCNHSFQEGEWVTVEHENGEEAVYCEIHNYSSRFSEDVEVIGKTRQELNMENDINE